MACQQLSFYARFRDGSLHIASKRGILQIEAMPAVTARRFDLKSPTGPFWEDCFPRLRLDRLVCLVDNIGLVPPPEPRTARSRHLQVPPDVLEAGEACLAFLLASNVELCRTIAKFGMLHFTMLYYATRLRVFRRLIDTNRGLAFALTVRVARLHRKPQQGLDLLKGLLNQRENEIAQKLGFPPGSWKILKRLCPGGLTVNRLQGFRRSLWKPDKMRIARHLPRLGPDVMELLTYDQMAAAGPLLTIGNRFFHELSGQESLDQRMPRIARDLLAIASAQGQCFPDVPLHVTSLEQVSRLRERYLPCFDPDVLGILQRVRFPPPPIQGDVCIHPIERGAELLRESVIQRNCAVTMFDCVMSGEKYFYRVEAKFGFERCTVELLRENEEERSIWRLGEVRDPANHWAKRSTLESLAVWLADQQHLPDSRVLPKCHPLAFDHDPNEKVGLPGGYEFLCRIADLVILGVNLFHSPFRR